MEKVEILLMKIFKVGVVGESGIQGFLVIGSFLKAKVTFKIAHFSNDCYLF